MDFINSDTSGHVVMSAGGVTPGGANVPPAVTAAVLVAGSATGLVAVLAVIICCRCCRRATPDSALGSKMPKKR
jgi:hypothetical protein